MSAPFIWIIFPLLASIILFALQKWEKWVHLSGFLIAFLLSLLAIQLPVGESIQIRLWTGFPSILIQESVPLLATRLVIDNTFRPILILVFLATTVWFGGAYAFKINPLFIPIGLGFSGLICLALAITPGIYAPFFLEFGALVSIPVLSPPGKPALRGVRRFLTFQTLGMGLILLASWIILLATVQSGLQIDLLVPIILMGLGFALTLPIFPFHTWIPMISGESDPFSTLFFFYLLPVANFLLILEKLNELSLFSYMNEIIQILRLGAVSLIIVGGAGALIENSLKRSLGFAMTHQVGVSLLALSLIDFSRNILPNSVLFFFSFIPWGAGLAIWALALNIRIMNRENIHLSDLSGIIRQAPWVSAGILIGIFSTGGLPLLAGFPAYIGIWSQLILQSPVLALVSWLGNGLLILAGIRAFSVMAQASPQNKWQISESRLQIVCLTMGILFIMMLGLFPTVLSNPWVNSAALMMSSAP